MDMQKKKRHVALKIILGILAALILAAVIFCRFGGFGTGKSADVQEFKKYAQSVSSLSLPEGTRIVALGEATHGNAEFQQLKLEVLQLLVENYGVRAFALEADYGCCETANRFIHGADGTAAEAAKALGFQFYQTKETADLLSWMRDYNQTAPEGEDLHFYGFDMQRYEMNWRYLIEAAKELEIDTSELETIWDCGEISDAFTGDQRISIIEGIKAEILEKEYTDTAQAVHFADILLQNIDLGSVYEDTSAMIALRDKRMAENTLWILEQEEARGNSCIFISGHVGHMDQNGSYDKENRFMGRILADEIGEDAYYVIGTEFFKSKDNLPTGTGSRTTHTFFSRDPLAKAAKKSGEEISWLDFSAVPADSVLSGQLSGYCWLGSVGEQYNSFINALLMDFLPFTYRVWGSPSAMFDSMIFVTHAHPIQVVE